MPRNGHTAVLLDATVLVAGGLQNGSGISDAELYD